MLKPRRRPFATAAAAALTSVIANKITVNLFVNYTGTGGGASAGPDDGLFESYSSTRQNLINNAAPGDPIFSSLPNTASINGQSQVAVWNAQLKLFGLLGANDTTTDDGTANFSTDIQSNLLFGVAIHELAHAMGRVPYGPQPDIFEFYRYTSPGNRYFFGGIPASASYFSLDGGNTHLADYGLNSDPSDFLNSPASNLTKEDPFNEFYDPSTI